MYLIKPKYEIVTPLDRVSVLKSLEQIGRVCWKSEDKITDDSAPKFCAMILGKNHLSVIEHISMTVRFIVDRGVSHELVRHRLCSFSQESTRYCNYAKKGVVFIIPPWVDLQEGEYNHIRNYVDMDDEETRVPYTTQTWLLSLLDVESEYNALIEGGWTAQQARTVLPNSLKTEIVVTANLREWRHIFSLRCDPSAHPQMREVMIPLRDEMRNLLPEIFA